MTFGQSIDTAVLLAAGRGTRLRPHTDSTPKPLLVHRGRPTLDYLLLSLQDAGIKQVYLVVHHLADQLDAYARAWTSRHPQQVVCIEQSYLAGTAHALQCVFEAVPAVARGNLVLSATDYLVPRRFFPELLDFHATHGDPLSVSLKKLPEEELSVRSSIRFHDDGSIAEIVEKPEPGTAPSDVGANLTVVLPEGLADYVDDVPVSARGEREVQHAINAWLAEGGRAQGMLQGVPPEWQPPLQ